MKGSFGQNGFAGQYRPHHSFRNFNRPRVVRIMDFQEGHQEAGVGDGVHLREYPLRDERSGGPPLMMPAYFLHG